jgi:hypothetical protein
VANQMITECSPSPATNETRGRLGSAVVKAVTIVAGSLALVLGVGSNAYASSNTQLCPPKHTDSGPPGTQTGDPTKDNSCNGIFDGSQTGSVVKTTSAGLNESVVSPGQTITVTLRWDGRDFGWAGPAETEDCVQIGSKVSRLSQEHGRAPLTGADTFSYQVPADTGGQQICDRGVVWGYGATGGNWRWYRSGFGGGNQTNAGPEKSAILCYSVLGAATPEAPSVILFPVAALLVVGAGYVVSRRRRASTARHHSGGMTLSVRPTGRHQAAGGKPGP